MDFETDSDAASEAAAVRGSGATKPAAARKPAAPRQPATPRKPAAARKPAVPRTPATAEGDRSADRAQDQTAEQVGNAEAPAVNPAPKAAPKPPAKPRAPRAAPVAGAAAPAARKPAARKPAAKPTAARTPAEARKPPATSAAQPSTVPLEPVDPPAEVPVDPPSALPADPPTAKVADVAAAAVRPTTARSDVRPAIALPAAQPQVTPNALPVSAPGISRAPRKTAEQTKPAQPREKVLVIDQLRKSFGSVTAVAGIDLTVQAGSIFGIVGPNGAGKTTTLSMVTGLLRPDAGRILVHGADVWSDPVVAKRNMGVLPDRLRLFDRLTGAQLLHYSGVLRNLDRATVRSRSIDLAVAFGLEDALDRLVTDYSAGMMKKIALAAAMIHSPRVLILDEPFEAVDPVSAANVIEILQKYAEAGGTVVMSSHSMDLIQRICDSVAIIVRGVVLASGTMDEVRAGATLEDRFVELAGGRKAAEGMEWLHSFSD